MKYVALFLAASVVTAHAQPADPARDRAKKLYNEGTKQYDLRDYPAAITALRGAYDLFPDPLFLYDIAQSYRQLHECAEASGMYKNYLRNLPNADNRERVERFIAEMDDCVHREDTSRRAAAAPPPPPAAPNHRGLVLGGVASALAGIAIGGIGVYYSIDASNQARRVEGLCLLGCDTSTVTGLDQRGKSSDGDSVIAYAIGGAVLATGIGMVLWATLHVERPIVAATPGGVVVGATGRF